MNSIRNRIQGLLLVTVLISACSGSSSSSNDEVATGEGSISALHAIPDLGPVSFLIEETALATVDYKQLSGISEYDDLTYIFNFDIILPDASEFTRLVSNEVKIEDGKEYLFALSGSLADPHIILWEQFGRDWPTLLADAETAGTSITVLDVSFGHLAGTVGELDFYLSVPGTAPLPGNQIATLGNGAFQESIEIDADAYQLVVTSAGDPDNYLFASDPFTLTSALSLSFVVMDPDDSATSNLVVRLLGSGTSTELVDINAESEMRVLHGADNTGPLDVIVGDGFADPFLSALEFGSRSAYVPIQPGIIDLNITPAGNPGSFLAEESIFLTDGARHSFYMTGLPGQLSGFLLTDEARRLSTHALLRVYQGSARLNRLDFYLVPTGSDIALLTPNIPSLVYTGATGYQLVTPGDYDLVFTLPGTKTVVTGPLPQQLREFGIYDAIATDTSQTNIANLLFFSDETT